MKRKWLSSGSDFEKNIGYSRAVMDGDYIFVSGTTGYNYTNMTIASDVREQAKQCFVNISHALTEAGSHIDNIVRVHYIFTERSDFEPCWPIFKQNLHRARPAATMFIAGLYDDKMKLEIEVTARIS